MNIQTTEGVDALVTKKKNVNVHTHAGTPVLPVPLPAARHDPQAVTWHECANWKTNSEKPFWHFSKLPTGLIPHPLYHTINTSEEQERKGEMDTLTLTDNNEFPTVSADIPTPTPHPSHSIPQPPSRYCEPHNYSHSKTTPHCPGSAVQPPVRNSSETAENRKWEGYEAVSTAGDAWVRPWTISSRPQFEGEAESGARWALKGEFITRLEESHFLLGRLSTLQLRGSWNMAFGAGCKNGKKFDVTKRMGIDDVDSAVFPEMGHKHCFACHK